MVNRLSLIDENLPERLRAAVPAVRREVARAVALAAADHTGLDDPRLTRMLALLRAGAAAEPAELTATKAVVEELDNAALDAHDRLENGTGTEADYIAQFTKARAATAVIAAFNDDTTHAAEDAIYEAYHAVDDDMTVIRGAIEASLERASSPGHPCQH